jgi:hypothetical protein
MAKLFTLVVALAAVSAVMLWSNSPAGNRSPDADRISPQELHALAHLEGLPIQDYEDQSVIHPARAER